MFNSNHGTVETKWKIVDKYPESSITIQYIHTAVIGLFVDAESYLSWSSYICNYNIVRCIFSIFMFW
jgi:fucose 4-O-acetylase-like acetyltransferase